MIRILLLILTGLLCTGLNAQLTVNPLFQAHAVLQRDVEVPFKGKADPGTNINVEIGDHHRVVTADSNGEWRVLLPKMEAGGPHEIVITSDRVRIAIPDIYFGDVWLCSGQSNMEWPVWQCDNAEEELSAAGDQGLRHIGIPHSGGTDQFDVIGGGQWQVDSPENSSNFTGVGYFFARHLREQRDIPIGLLHSSWGGSRIEPWMRSEILGYGSNAESAVLIDEKRKKEADARMARLLPIVGQLTEEDQGMDGDDPVWANTDHDISNWNSMKLPGLWEDGPMPELDGVVWYSVDINLDEDHSAASAMLNLSKIDDSDHTYVNGQLVGHMSNQYAKLRNYNIPAGVLKKGKNRITIRVEDYGGGGGIYGEDQDMSLEIGSLVIDLATTWSYKASAMYASGTQNVNQQATLLYNHMIYPLLDFPIKGAIWYQGESNAGAEESKNYNDQLSTMITDWRKLWGIGDFPFLSVQLANFQEENANTSDGGWPRIREAIAKVSVQLDNTGDAVAIDIGDPDDIHPTNKQEVGRRLGLIADHMVYDQKDIVWNSPRFKHKKVEGSNIVITLDYVGEGLITKNKFGYVQGFEIAGEDQRFYWAKAELSAKDKITISSSKVDHPVHVRYAWSINPGELDIYNSNNLPLSPFRTDSWDYPSLKYLALGDSYTAGTSVEQAASFPYQLRQSIASPTLKMDVDVIAKNGWTTTDLLDSMALVELDEDYDMVTLLIGVNNQYQGKPFSLYEEEFEVLLAKAIAAAGGDANKVAVVSIPDYAYSAYGQTRPNPSNISIELDKYNAYADKMARKHGAHYVYITDITRSGLEDEDLVAKDKLHPSGKAYEKMVPRIKKEFRF